ncbi:MAG: hypothetical protein EAZ99_17665 [Alphaproteobacteria bacterium]|nr:hypothetical protein [Alphaproteobacteria bacterium]TAD87427.1 MAG: hypothetical protein EAZ99_17665 [Alphaproteobacteria bacterium]
MIPSRRDLCYRLARARLELARDLDRRQRLLREGNHRLRQPLQAARLFAFLIRQRLPEASAEFGSKLDQTLDGLDESWTSLHAALAVPPPAVVLEPVPLQALWDVAAELGRPFVTPLIDDPIGMTDAWLLFDALSRAQEAGQAPCVTMADDTVLITQRLPATALQALLGLPGHDIDSNGRIKLPVA